MKCKNCKKYIPIATSGHGVCSLPSGYFPTEAENNCHYISDSITCKDCGRFRTDSLCMTVNEDDDASHCGGFIDIHEENVLDAFRVWLSRGKYSREKVLRLCDKFEKCELYDVISNALEQK